MFLLVCHVGTVCSVSAVSPLQLGLLLAKWLFCNSCHSCFVACSDKYISLNITFYSLDNVDEFLWKHCSKANVEGPA